MFKFTHANHIHKPILDWNFCMYFLPPYFRKFYLCNDIFYVKQLNVEKWMNSGEKNNGVFTF